MVGKVIVQSEDREEKLVVAYTVNVNASGIFTTTLKEEDVKLIESYGIMLHTNGRYGARPGFFESDTFKGLSIKISAILQECLSRTCIQEEILIQYSIATMASFGFTVEDIIIPNLSYTEDGQPDLERYWQGGTVSIHAADPSPVGILFYVQPCIKKTYLYKSGSKRVEYEKTSAFGGTSFKGDQYHYLRWLEQIPCTIPPRHGSLKEIDYTEERAKFFVDMFKSICMMAYKVTQFIEPEKMIRLIEAKGSLLALNK